MLESRNSVWEYDYMSFSRRIGELWEPFCKLAFEFPLKSLEIITPPKFENIQTKVKKDVISYINLLSISEEEKMQLNQYWELPWRLLDSVKIQLNLNLYFS